VSENKETEQEGFVNVSIYIQKDLLDLLDRIAAEKKLNRSQFVRQCFGQYLHDMTLKFHPPEAGVYVDSSGTPVFIGLLSDEGRSKVQAGTWKLVKEF
jgi:hypothetical protein